MGVTITKIDELNAELKEKRSQQQKLGNDIAVAERDYNNCIKQLKDLGIEFEEDEEIDLASYIDEAKQLGKEKEKEAVALLEKVKKRFEKLNNALEDARR